MMKKIILVLTPMVFFMLFLMSCAKDDQSSTSDLSANLTAGKTWKVSYYYDTDKDETYKLASYTFEFLENGTLNAANSSGSSTGSWSASDNRFVISMGSVSPLDIITDDWLIVSTSDNEIKLRDDNTSKTEELHFTLL